MQLVVLLLLIIVISIISLSIHELGHLIAGKIFKVNVIEYSIGVGPMLFFFHYKGVKYSFRLFLIGAFVLFDSKDLRLYSSSVVAEMDITYYDPRKFNWTRWEHFKWLHKWGNFTISNYQEYNDISKYLKYLNITKQRKPGVFLYNEIAYYQKLIIMSAGVISNLILFFIFFGLTQINEVTGSNSFQLHNLVGVFDSVLKSLVFIESDPPINFSEMSDLQFFLIFGAIFNITIAVFNALPFPPLDMFKIITATYERITGKIVSQTANNAFAILGIILILYATFVPIITVVIGV